MQFSNHGGRREGAGRPKVDAPKSKTFGVRLTPKEIERVKQKGGSKWVRDLILANLDK